MFVSYKGSFLARGMQHLWNVAPVFSPNLIKCGMITPIINEKISQDAVATFEAYCSSKNHAGVGAASSQSASSTKSRRTRHRKGRSPSQSSNLNISQEAGIGLTINDYFFEHQRINGYINGTPILSRSQEIHELNDTILLEVEKYLLLLGGKTSDVTEMIHSGILSLDMWSAIQYGKGANHKDHVHEGVLVSGVYYSSVPEGSSPLLFHKPSINNDGTHEYNAEHEEARTTDSIHILEPEEGQIVLFPPWLLHGVPPMLTGDKPRISFAFNLSGAYAKGDPWAVTKN